MSRLPDEFHQDRALRDAARDVLMADIEHAKAAFSGKALAGRVTGRIGDGAKDALDVAKGHAGEHRGLIAGLIALIMLWLAREPVSQWLGFGDEDSDSADHNATADSTAIPDPGDTELDEQQGVTTTLHDEKMATG